jgi:hypothetical protein
MISISIRFATCLLAALALIITPAVAAKKKKALSAHTEIPDGYRSWALFLVCNTAWIIQNGDKGIQELHDEFSAFGRSIGDDNLAVWLLNESDKPPTVENTDIERSTRYCQKYRLSPSQGPYVLVTTRNPDVVNSGDRLLVRLNGLTAHDSAQVLNTLTDQLVSGNLSQAEIDSSERGWLRLLGAVATAAGCYFNKVSFSLNAGAVKAEVAHSADNKSAAACR